MIPALTALLGFQLAGELIVRLAGIPVPGPVLGMVLLAGFFAVRGGVPDDIRNVAAVVLRHLSLLFVAALLGSSILTLLVTVLVFRFCAGAAKTGREDAS